MIDLDAVVDSAVRMEPLSATASRLMTIVTEEDVDLRKVVDVVSYDQALTARLLRTANSALMAGAREIATVKDAVVRLGSGVVLSFAIATSMKPRLNEALPQYGLGEGELWKHSVTTALAAETMRPFCLGVSLPPETFTAALLHDIGKLVLSRFMNDDVLEVLRQAHEQGERAVMEAEAATVGVTHAELGALISKAWQLPATITHGIRYHHEPESALVLATDNEATGGDDAATMSTIANVVHISDVLAQSIDFDPESNSAKPEIHPASCEAVGLSQELHEKARKRVEERVESLLQAYA